MARLFHLSRTTVARKLIFLAQLKSQLFTASLKAAAKATVVEFDDVETFEHSNCKPLSITLAVESGTRRILGFSVSQMPAKGHLAVFSRKKYGFRKDERPKGRAQLFTRLQSLVTPEVILKSDESPHYPKDVRKYFPKAEHQTFLGRRGSLTGQGELKKIVHDPLFSLNHTAAMLRANINRLARKTWCTTKKKERLADHLSLYVHYHNDVLLKNPSV